MHKNKKQDMTPFDMKSPPKRQKAFMLPLIWGVSRFLTLGAKIDRSAVKGLKPPYLVYSAHQGFSDYYLLPRALFPHRATYVSDMEGFANYGKRLYSLIGCIGCRRFVNDFRLVKNIMHAVNVNKDIVVVFPEARHSDDGRSSPLPDSVGRLAKLLNIPVVTAEIHGSYVKNPFWDEENGRHSKLSVSLKLAVSGDEIKTISAKEIQKRVEASLTYDEHRYMAENNIKWSGAQLAHGLEKVLFRCINCGEKDIRSEGCELICGSCGKHFRLCSDGTLRSEKEEITVTQWYDYCRNETEKLIDCGQYKADYNVNVEALPNEKGFVALGNGRLTHIEGVFTLTTDNGLCFSTPKTLFTVQNEYNYQGKGQSLVLSNRNCCYYIYPLEKDFNVTEIRFAQEYFYKRVLSKSTSKSEI